jgi:hypothetical protein
MSALDHRPWRFFFNILTISLPALTILEPKRRWTINDAASVLPIGRWRHAIIIHRQKAFVQQRLSVYPFLGPCDDRFHGE